MSPKHHFAEYRRTNPKDYQTFSDNMWNGFVSITHAIGLGKFFSFTPDFSNTGELDGEAVGKALGEIYIIKEDYDEAENFWRDLGRP